MDWRETYRRKLTTAEEAVKHIKSGDRIVVGHACGSPEILIKAMVAAKDPLEKVELLHLVSMGPSEYCLPESAGHFIHNSFFAGATTRRAINEGRAVFTPSHFSQVPRLFTDGILPVDVTLCMLSIPDEHGYCSFGVSVDYTKPAAERSKLVIAEITPHMPRTLGDSFIHVSKIDCIVESESKPLTLTPPEITAIDEKIGLHCSELITDGDCLQLGIGAVPDAILHFLGDKKDLGIHTEMFSDGVVDLVEKGVVTCRRKNIHTGKMVATFFMGTEKLYRFIHNNPMVEMHSVNYTNNPAIIAQNDKVVSINSTIQIDLTGQACSESIGHRQYSGTGGQADFVRGAAWSRGGRSILAFRSTASKGTVSRITPRLNEGAVVTATRTDVHYVVTEYGIADLRGKSVPQRAKALINIAHPDFRENLQREFSRMYNYNI
ncbi:MAG: acetyl-CoA hydrolase/transferase family protein [Deltaproteobacteria bacterium]|nr:acetyl-CoA hydrolase/transferase family protein [Deltaproteobacteria bacterium]